MMVTTVLRALMIQSLVRSVREHAGGWACAVAPVSYTVANLCLRGVATTCDPVWVTWMRAAVPAVVLAPYLGWGLLRRRTSLPPRRVLLPLLLAAMVTQLGGNLMYQHALQLVGITITVPAAFGCLLVGSALLGRAVLHERLTLRLQIGMALVLASLALLSTGARLGSVSCPTAAAGGGWEELLRGLGVALIAGMCYAVATVVMRRAVVSDVEPTMVVFLVTLVGTLCLAPLGCWRTDLSAWATTSGHQFAMLLGGGLFNLIGFVAFTTGLRRTSVANANVLNAAQVALSTVLGIGVFGEPSGDLALLGLTLNAAGLLCAVPVRVTSLESCQTAPLYAACALRRKSRACCFASEPAKAAGRANSPAAT